MRIEYSRSGQNERGRDRSHVEGFFREDGKMAFRLHFETADGTAVAIELDEAEARTHLQLMRVMAS